MATSRDFSQMTEVKGLKELRAELRNASPEMAKRLQVINKKLVSNIADKAQAAFYSSVASVSPSVRTGPLQKRPSGRGSIGRSRSSIRGTASQLEAKVVAGGAKAPGFFGHEFGGRARARTRQFPQHKGRQGYVLYPIVRRERETAFEQWNDLFDDIMSTKAGPA